MEQNNFQHINDKMFRVAESGEVNPLHRNDNIIVPFSTPGCLETMKNVDHHTCAINSTTPSSSQTGSFRERRKWVTRQTKTLGFITKDFETSLLSSDDCSSICVNSEQKGSNLVQEIEKDCVIIEPLLPDEIYSQVSLVLADVREAIHKELPKISYWPPSQFAKEKLFDEICNWRHTGLCIQVVDWLFKAHTAHVFAFVKKNKWALAQYANFLRRRGRVLELCHLYVYHFYLYSTNKCICHQLSLGDDLSKCNRLCNFDKKIRSRMLYPLKTTFSKL